MNTQSATSSPNLFIAVDMHKKSWAVHMRTDIFEHKKFTCPAKVSILEQYVDKHFSYHQIHITYEAGCCGFNTARYFLNLGWNVVVVNPADVPRAHKQSLQKTDAIDCRNLSKQLQQGQLRAIHIPTEAHDYLKSLLRLRAKVTYGLRAIKNRIKSHLLYHGIVIPEEMDKSTWSKKFIQWLSNISWDHSTGQYAMESMLRIYHVHEQEYRHVANELRAYCRKYHTKDYKLLRSVPGIGGYLAASILAELGDLRRFNREDQLAAFVGLVPIIHNSGNNERVFGMTPRCRKILRSYLIEAAWIAVRRDPELQIYWRKHHGKNSKTVLIKIARKLLCRILSVVKSETPYKINYKASLSK